ncbi:MAG: hypothetical protein N2Z80_04980 [Hydrogenothermaceae bacterium]|nr:hypothetical protein [Hydrogenothermaceae bacterium]
MEELKILKDHYIKKLNLQKSELPRIITDFFEEALYRYELSKIVEAIDISFNEILETKNLTPQKIIKILQRNLESVQVMSEAEKDLQNNQTQISVPPSPPKPETKKQVKYEGGRTIWNNIFKEYNIPRDLISQKEISKLQPDLRNFYISKKVAEYIYSKMSQQERENLERTLKSRLSRLNTQSDKEREEAKKLSRIYLIKKLYNIPF